MVFTLKNKFIWCRFCSGCLGVAYGFWFFLFCLILVCCVQFLQWLLHNVWFGKNVSELWSDIFCFQCNAETLVQAIMTYFAFKMQYSCTLRQQLTRFSWSLCDSSASCCSNIMLRCYSDRWILGLFVPVHSHRHRQPTHRQQLSVYSRKLLVNWIAENILTFVI